MARLTLTNYAVQGEGALTIERFEVPPREIVLEARRPGYQSAFWGLPEDWNSEELLATASSVSLELHLPHFRYFSCSLYSSQMCIDLNSMENSLMSVLV